MEEALISVIIPVYNAAPYLCRCVDSVLDQTHHSLEIFLVDDGSSDGSERLCDQYSVHDVRVHVIHQENLGAFAARDRALALAQGKYIGFVDADDWLEPEMYEVLLSLLQENGAEAAQCEMENDGNYRQLRTVHLGRETVYSGENRMTCAMFRNEITHNLTNKLFCANVWQEFRFESDLYHLDAVFISQIAKRCRSLVRTDRQLYHYNTTNSSITRGQKNRKHLKSMERLFEAYSTAAMHVPGEGDFFICREIPSGGRLIMPCKRISICAAVRHIRYMYEIFLRHWPQARQFEDYHAAPLAKRLLWHIYAHTPLAASLLVYMRMRLLAEEGELI